MASWTNRNLIQFIVSERHTFWYRTDLLKFDSLEEENLPVHTEKSYNNNSIYDLSSNPLEEVYTVERQLSQAMNMKF